MFVGWGGTGHSHWCRMVCGGDVIEQNFRRISTSTSLQSTSLDKSTRCTHCYGTYWPVQTSLLATSGGLPYEPLWEATTDFSYADPWLQSSWILPTVIVWLTKTTLMSLLPTMHCEHLPKPASLGPTWSIISLCWNMFRHGCPEHPSNGRLVNGVVWLVKCLRANSGLWSRIWWADLQYIFTNAQRTSSRQEALQYHALQQEN